MLGSLAAKAAHLLSGKRAEDKAYDYLIKQGLQPVCRNYRCKHGELDLVMRDGQWLVIVEVRYRKSDIFGSAKESVTLGKRTKIIAATQHYLSASRDDCPLRFDVVTLSSHGEIDWIKNAF